MSQSLKRIGSGIDMSVDDIVKTIGRIDKRIDGFTISGGEPFLQAEELVQLVCALNVINDDILIYTGYSLEWLKENKSSAIERILPKVSAVIDGEYVKSKDDSRGIRGSSNQRVHVFKYPERYRDAENCERKVQIINHKQGMTLIGLP